VYTDFLPYASGLYHRSEEAFKFNGNHIVKLLGWEKGPDGQEFWIAENTWGSDWGEQGYFRVLANDQSTGIDQYTIGVAAYPMTMGEYY
jgi:cathepsin B